MKYLLSIIAFLILTISGLLAQETDVMKNKSNQDAAMEESNIPESEKLVVLWTSGDPEVAKKMVFMYTYNAQKNGWWKDITLIVWGPSAKLLTEDKELQETIKNMDEIGIHLLACKGCADQYDVSEDLEKLGIEVKYIGVDLTDFIKGDYHLVTF